MMKSGYATLQEKFKALDEREQSSSAFPMSSPQFDATVCSVATDVEMDTESKAVTFATDHDSLLDERRPRRCVLFSNKFFMLGER